MTSERVERRELFIEDNGGNKERLRKRTFYILYYLVEGSNLEMLCPV